MENKELGKTAKGNQSKLEKTGAEQILKNIKTSADITVPHLLVDQVIGQKKAVEVIKKAASQKRNVLLAGTPGTGKSMLAQAMAELMPTEQLEDILITQNVEDENTPKVKIVKAGEGKPIAIKEKMKNRLSGGNMNLVVLVLLMLGGFFLLQFGRQFYSDVIVAAMLMGLFIVAGMLAFATALGRGKALPGIQEGEGLKVLIDNSEKKRAPFIDATGARAGALLGDVRHDPFQSFAPENKLYLLENGKLKAVSFEALWKKMAAKYKKKIETRKEQGLLYEAILLPEKEKLFTMGYKGGMAVPSRIALINRRHYVGNVVEVTATGKQIMTTPEHKFILAEQEKEAKELSTFDELIANDVKIIKRRRY